MTTTQHPTQDNPFAPVDYSDPFGDDDPNLWTTIDHDSGEIVNESTALAELDQAWIAYGEIRTPRQALDLSDKAAAIAYYLKRSGAELQVQNRAAAVKLLSEYKAGRLLREMPDARGNQYTQRVEGNTMLPSTTPTLADLGISKMQSSRLQALAGLEEGEVREYISNTAENNKEVTTAGALKVANHNAGQQRRAEHAAQTVELPNAPSVALASWDAWLPYQDDCDLLLTDPPYSTDIVDIAAFAAAWLPSALAKVKPTGRAYVCIGAYPEEIAAYLAADRRHMTLAQILIWTYRNATNRQPKYDYILNYQAILYFRGPEAPALDAPSTVEQFAVQDINAPDARLDDERHRRHAWQKPSELAERLIRHSTQAGALVLDPFAGTGTFVLAAARLDRVGRGCDNESSMLTIAKERGCEIE